LTAISLVGGWRIVIGRICMELDEVIISLVILVYGFRQDTVHDTVMDGGLLIEPLSLMKT
jgi:hypothetical protein